MGNADSTPKGTESQCTLPPAGREGETKNLKACCACPETKKLRDECTLLQGEEQCEDVIEAHKACMRRHGFQV